MGIRPADKTGQEALLSEDRYLLRQIGIFFHGEEWQAPLARDLHVRNLQSNARISCNSGKAHRWPDPGST
jgi:hypothetical protein